MHRLAGPSQFLGGNFDRTYMAALALPREVCVAVGGRHRAPGSPGGHQPSDGRSPRRSSSTLRSVAVGAAVLAVVAVSVGGYRLLAADSCASANTVRLDVAAAPEIAPAVRDAAAQWVATRPRISGGRCAAVRVVGADNADVAAAVAGSHN